MRVGSGGEERREGGGEAVGLCMMLSFPWQRFYSEDAAMENKGIRAMGYTIELRDDGNNGFLLPASEVRGEES